MGRRPPKSDLVFFEVHVKDSPKRITRFRYPQSTTKRDKDWKVRDGEVQIAECCFAVVGEGDAYQWGPGMHHRESAERIAALIPDGMVVQAAWRKE